MTGMMIIRTKNDNRAWLVGLDGAIVSEIESEALAYERSLAFDADKAIAVEIRAHAASHAQFAD